VSGTPEAGRCGPGVAPASANAGTLSFHGGYTQTHLFQVAQVVSDDPGDAEDQGRSCVKWTNWSTLGLDSEKFCRALLVGYAAIRKG
jgi:hypothetical protein